MRVVYQLPRQPRSKHSFGPSDVPDHQRRGRVRAVAYSGAGKNRACGMPFRRCMKFGWPRVERDAARVAELRSDASAADESGSLQNGSIGRAQHPANLALLTLGASETALTFLVDLVPLADRRCERSAEVTGTTTLIEKPMPALAGCADLQSAFLRCHLKHRA